MNQQKLYEAEALFFTQYPGGFDDPGLDGVRKKHNVDKVTEFAKQQLAKKNFSQPAQILDAMTKIVTRSSMISMFEKPKYRDFVNGLSRTDRGVLSDGYQKLIHGNQEKGFNQVLDVLSEAKLAKWSLMTIAMYSYRPQKEVFVKPTTTKNVIRHFEVEGLEYKPRPSWAFYKAYRELITNMKAQVHPSLSPNNAAFTGFFMMTTGGK